MEVITVRDLVRCVGQYLARELTELGRMQARRGALPEYCSRARLILRRLKKVLQWARSHSGDFARLHQLDEFLAQRTQVFEETVSTLSIIHYNQVANLRTSKFAVNEAGELLCQGEYRGFPPVDKDPEVPKVPLSRLSREIKHKLLLMDAPATVSLE